MWIKEVLEPRLKLVELAHRSFWPDPRRGLLFRTTLEKELQVLGSIPAQGILTTEEVCLIHSEDLQESTRLSVSS